MERLWHWLGLGGGLPFRLSPEAAVGIGRAIEATEETELDCEQVYRLLDQFAEAVSRGEDSNSWMPLIRAHLDKCSDCRQEYEALLRALQLTWS
ncbi:MAG: hypothetical protein ACRDHG_01675 [Anaerolineales bacterium]